MKKLYLISVLIVFIGNCYAQDSDLKLQSERDSVYYKYLQHKDTMTIRTWINVITLNKYLEQLKYYDSLVIEELGVVDLKHSSTIISLQHELVELKKNQANTIAEDQVKELQSPGFKKYFFITVIAAIVFLFALLIVLIRFYKQAKIMSELKSQTRDYHTKWYAAKEKIIEFEKTEMQLASEINNLKSNNGTDLKSLKQAKTLAEEERLMLENQIAEIKKAYDLEVKRRQEIEMELALAGERSDMTEELRLALERSKELAIQLKESKKENLRLGEDLGRLSDTLEDEIIIRNRVEEELEVLRKSQDPGKVQGGDNTADLERKQNEKLEELLQQNKVLVFELEKAQKSFESEIRNRLQIEEELDILLKKLKKRV